MSQPVFHDYSAITTPSLCQQLFCSLSGGLCDGVQVEENEGDKDEEDWGDSHQELQG